MNDERNLKRTCQWHSVVCILFWVVGAEAMGTHLASISEDSFQTETHKPIIWKTYGGSLFVPMILQALRGRRVAHNPLADP